jgi:enoyl-CoA hydratase/carnithine racemase
MAFTGRHERMSARRAYELGIVSDVVAPERLHDASQELAEKFARNDPGQLAATKRALWGVLETTGGTR